MAKEAALRSVDFFFTHVRLELELNSGLGRWKLGLGTLGIPASKFLPLDFLRSIFLKNGFLGMDRATMFEYIHTYTLAQYVKIRRVGSIFGLPNRVNFTHVALPGWRTSLKTEAMNCPWIL